MFEYKYCFLRNQEESLQRSSSIYRGVDDSYKGVELGFEIFLYFEELDLEVLLLRDVCYRSLMFMCRGMYVFGYVLMFVGQFICNNIKSKINRREVLDEEVIKFVG